MKNSLHLPLSGAMLVALMLFIFSPQIFAQEKEVRKEVKIKIIKKENGETTVINKMISVEDESKREEILDEYDEPEMSVPGKNEEVEIVIKKKKGGREDEKSGREKKRSIKK